MSFNRIQIVGNLGRDPELRYTPQGTPVCSFTVASNDRRKGRTGEQQQDITTWFRVTTWGQRAEAIAQYLNKGRMVYVEGKLHVEDWTDKEGKPRYTLEVDASDVEFFSSNIGTVKDGIVHSSPDQITNSEEESSTSTDPNQEKVSLKEAEIDDGSSPF